MKLSLGLPANWDLLLIGDGSAQYETGTCGWAVTVYERETKTRRVFYGAGSAGDSQFAELVPYVYAMCWYARRHGSKPAPKPKNVHIVTDSRNTAIQGNKLAELIDNPLRLQATRFLWTTIQQLAQEGYTFVWYWRKRNELLANQRMNRLAQTARRQFAVQQRAAIDGESE